MKSSSLIHIFLFLQIVVGLHAEQPIELQLPDPYNDAQNEYSGLAWFADYVVLLPQYPNGYLPALAKSELLKAITSEDHSVLPIRIPFSGDDFTRYIPGFEGFEAIVFVDTLAYLSIEVETRKGLKGVFVRASVPSLAEGITLHSSPLLEIDTPEIINNMAFESLLYTNDQLIPLYEANGAKVNPDAWVPIVSPDLQVVDKMPFPSIEFRITDATQPTADQCFWVINYLWHGDYFILKPANDFIANPFGNVTRKSDVERLIEMKYDGNFFTLTDTPPIYLTKPEEQSHNWEGIVRVDSLGFLLISDEHPRTILQFVPHAF